MQYTLTYREVVEILTLLREAQTCRSVDIEVGDLKISVRGRESDAGDRPGGKTPATGARAAVAAPGPGAAAGAGETERETAGPIGAEGEAAAAASRRQAGADGAVSSGTFVRAPMLGTFYRASEPGAKPFVEVGDLIGPQTAIGLIEVMKLFSSVTSGVAGRVVEILASNGALVEYDQPLIRVEAAE
ncbi:MAG: acetyl-CoA carboxylase biotin carboxyl carrier protein [Burkholderiaceae bacterium]|nr:acetyl-CoA carboxylase biotin carboxyl carrier protein [Burkholderiaceae bacterium]